MEHERWLEQVGEEILEPELAICDPHHHLWDRGGSRYLLDELLADTGSGHNVVSTVFVECASMYRADARVRRHRRLRGPEPRRHGRRGARG